MKNDLDQILDCATYAGKLLLESGAEIYRVEDTICRICKNYGAEEADSFSLPTGIFVTVACQGRSVSRIVRIKNRGSNVDRIDRINSLSRKSSTLSLDEFRKELKEIKNTPANSLLLKSIGGGVGAAGFVLFFSGGLPDLLYAFIIGMFVEATLLFLEKRNFPSFFSISLCSALTAILAILLVQTGLIHDMDTVIISCLMLLVPGLAITNAIRDSLSGDLVSGTSRGVEAILIAISVAVGPGLVMSLWMALGGRPLW